MSGRPASEATPSLVLAGSGASPTEARAGAQAGATGTGAIICQCRDADLILGPAGILMADAMLRCHDEGMYDVILSVHDELIAECDEDKGSVEDFEAIMAHVPDWAEGCPVAAEGWSGYRYKK